VPKILTCLPHAPLLIRVDSSVDIGAGHIMRCLALAEAWHDFGGRVIFVVAKGAPEIETRLKSEGIEVFCLKTQAGGQDDASQTTRLALKKGACWIVVDGYHFGAEYQKNIKNSGLHLLFIDDYGHAGYYYADIILNHNAYASESLYVNRSPSTKLLLGNRYALLRRDFLKWREYGRETLDVAHKVLVTMGGTDPHNVTLKVIRALQQIKVAKIEAVVVVGEFNQHYDELRTAAKDPRLSIRFESSTSNMSELMAWADVAVSAAGVTSLELAFMGIPNILLILADNQRLVAEYMNKVGAAINLGWHQDVSSDKIAEALTKLLADANMRREMAQRGRELVDGDGAVRVLMHMDDGIFHLRNAREDDCRLIWEWRNDPASLAVSFSSEPIPWEQHMKWFKTYDPNRKMYVAENIDGVPIGQIRFDFKGNEAVASITIDEKFRGKGYGSRLIRFASKRTFTFSGIDLIHAYVKQSNEASVRSFKNAGFKIHGPKIINGHEAIDMVLMRGDLR